MERFRRIVASYETRIMSVQHEIKSQLAKLLATEDLVVEHRKVETAQFNVHTRVLTLPLWEKASNVVYDLLVGHEVGHALFTPDENWLEEVKVPPQFVNIVEDARVEKLMKRKYMGLAKSFFNGYKELSDSDFFSLEGEDISKMNLADRANLWFKIGSHVDVPIERGEEMEIINMIAETETFADVLIVAEQLYRFCKQQKENEEKVDDIDSQEQQGDSQSPASELVDSNSSSSEEEGESDKSSPQDSEGDSGASNNDGIPSSSAGNSGEPEVRTADSLEEKLRDLVNSEGCDNVYVEIPQVNLDTIIAKNADVHKEINNSFLHQEKNHKKHAEEKGFPALNLFNQVDIEFYKFKKSAQKEVNYLVKEFECKKAADSYARATTARTVFWTVPNFIHTNTMKTCSRKSPPLLMVRITVSCLFLTGVAQCLR